MRQLSIIGLVFLLSVTHLMAQSVSPAAPHDPCSHSVSPGISVSSNMGGIDMDAMRCQLSVALQAAQQQSTSLISAEANMRMLQSDMASAQAQIADLTKALAEKAKVAAPEKAK